MSRETSADVAIQPLGGAGLPAIADSAPTDAAEISDAIDAATNGHESGWDRLFSRFYGTVRTATTRARATRPTTNRSRQTATETDPPGPTSPFPGCNRATR